MQNYSTGKYARSRNRMIAGVCAMIARETGIDVGLVRIVTVAATVLTSGAVAVVYLAAWAVLPMEGETTTVLDDLIGKTKSKVNDHQAQRNGDARSNEWTGPGTRNNHGPADPSPGPSPRPATSTSGSSASSPGSADHRDHNHSAPNQGAHDHGAHDQHAHNHGGHTHGGAGGEGDVFDPYSEG